MSGIGQLSARASHRYSRYRGRTRPDRFGRIPALLAGIGLYVLGAIGSILAPTIGWLFVARLVWGLGAAACATIRVCREPDAALVERLATLEHVIDVSVK